MGNSLFVEEGDSGSLASRLVRYFDVREPGYTKTWVGASEDELRQFQDACVQGAQLPADYLSFARGLGVCDGGILGLPKIITDLPELLDFYEECLRNEPETLNPELPVVGLYEIGDQISLDLRPDGNGAVVSSTDGEFNETLAESWETFVVNRALMRGESRRLPIEAWMSWLPNEHHPDVVDVISEFAFASAMSVSWSSDAYFTAYIGEKSSLFLSTRDHGFMCVFYSETNDFLDEASREIASVCHVDVSRLRLTAERVW